MPDTRSSVKALAVSGDTTARVRVHNLPPTEFLGANGVYSNAERQRAIHEVRAILNSQLGKGVSVAVDGLGPA